MSLVIWKYPLSSPTIRIRLHLMFAARAGPTADQTLDAILRRHRRVAFLDLFRDVGFRAVLDFIIWREDARRQVQVGVNVVKEVF
jgi:hypothetical protein